MATASRPRLLRLYFAGLGAEALLLLTSHVQTGGGFLEVLVVLAGARTRLGGQQQAGAGAHRAVLVGSSKPLPRALPPPGRGWTR